MSDHRAPRARRRTVGRASAVITGGVLAISGLVAGTASADEGHEATGGFTPTSPVDGFANHWMMYHYGEENFAANEAERISSDPKRYVDIHTEMAKEMYGQSPESHESGKSGKSDKSDKGDKGSKTPKKGGNPY